MFTYDDISYEQDCCYCDEKQEKLDEGKYWFKEILDIVYHNGAIEDLENCLEELGAKFGVNLPAGDLKVVKKNASNDVSDLLHLWKVANNKYIKSLAKVGA